MARIWVMPVKGNLIPIKDASSAYQVLKTYGYKKDARLRIVRVSHGAECGVRSAQDLLLYIPGVCVIILDKDAHYVDNYVVGRDESEMEGVAYE